MIEKISVVLPVYNGEKYLREALDGLASQTRAVDEVVIVNDGSTDGSEKIIAESSLGNVKYLKIENSGTARARLHGIHQSSGDLICFCDQDDIWRPEKIEKQLRHIGSSDLIHTNGLLLRGGKPAGDLWSHFKIRPQNGGRELLPRFFDRNQIINASVMVRRPALMAALPLPDELYRSLDIDYGVWLKMLENNCQFSFLNEPLVIYREHVAQQTKNFLLSKLWLEYDLRAFLQRNPEFASAHPVLVRKKYLKIFMRLLMSSIQKPGALSAAELSRVARAVISARPS